jgi:DNA methyltransferase 1-associated protein 1
MSGSDIRDILEISKPTELVQKKTKQTEKRPGVCFCCYLLIYFVYLYVFSLKEGISRELYSLIGGAPPVAFVKPTYKSKFQTKKKATPW